MGNFEQVGAVGADDSFTCVLWNNRVAYREMSVVQQGADANMKTRQQQQLTFIAIPVCDGSKWNVRVTKLERNRPFNMFLWHFSSFLLRFRLFYETHTQHSQRVLLEYVRFNGNKSQIRHETHS